MTPSPRHSRPCPARGKEFMNKKQRTILIIGATALLYFLFTSPKISIVKGTYVIPPSDKRDIARMIDVRTAMTRAAAILGATLLVSIALRDKKETRAQSATDREPILDGECQESEKQHVKKDVRTRIYRFLKDFF
jgi:hypothetical protein